MKMTDKRRILSQFFDLIQSFSARRKEKKRDSFPSNYSFPFACIDYNVCL